MKRSGFQLKGGSSSPIKGHYELPEENQEAVFVAIGGIVFARKVGFSTAIPGIDTKNFLAFSNPSMVPFLNIWMCI